MADSPCNAEQLDAIFVAAVQFIDPIIAKKDKIVPSLYRNKVERGPFQWGKTYLMKNQTHYGALPIQDSSASWSQTAPYRAPGTQGENDAGHDPCRFHGEVIEDGFEEKNFYLWEAMRRTTDICLNDILQGRFEWSQVLELKFEMLANVTIGEWEHITKDFYIDFTNKFFASPSVNQYGLLPFSANQLVFGTGLIPIPVGGLPNIGRLTQPILDRVYQWLLRQAPDAAVGTKDGMPIFGLITSPETSTEIIALDIERKRDVRYADPSLNLDGYGQVKAYQGFAHLLDVLAPRFEVDALGANLVRVYPFTQTATTVGVQANADPAYILAPFELSVIWLKNVYRANSPVASPTKISGYEFGPMDRMGTFTWLNIQERCENPHRLKGFFDALFQVSPEPLVHSNDAVSILHRRCNQLDLAYCIDDGDCDSVDFVSGAQHDVTEAVGAATQYDVTLDYKLNCGPGVEVTVAWVDAQTHVAIIVDDSAAPTYVIAFPHVLPAGWLVGPGGASTINHLTCDQCIEEPGFGDFFGNGRQNAGNPDQEVGIPAVDNSSPRGGKAAKAAAAKPEAKKE